MPEYQHFPTKFAQNLMHQAGLFHPGVFTMTMHDKEFEDADRWYGALRDFQKLSLFNTYEESLVAYHGIEISEEQAEALKLIHASSKTWALGHVAENLLSRLEDDPKQITDLARTIMEQIGNTDGTPSERIKRYVVMMAEN